MAYFECTTGLGAGGGATITVTYNSSFYNKTMTCSNGTKTYTKITTSSGSTEFKVSDEGTWTITCDGVSRTVNVVLNYTTQMAITKTVTVYGAAGATISFTDTMGSKTCTLDSSGEGSASITFIPPSQSITFTDTNVSKNPNDLTQDYSKSITITESTSSIKVMPDGAVYWWGWRGDLIELEASNHINYSITSGKVTFNTNSITIGTPTTKSYRVARSTPSTGSANIVYKGIRVYNGTYGHMSILNTSYTRQTETELKSGTITKESYQLTNQYGAVGATYGSSVNDREIELYAYYIE